MKKITRADLRGKHLEPFCQKAQISNYECGPKDNRQYCYGLVSKQTDELIYECANCKANVRYVTPLSGKEERE